MRPHFTNNKNILGIDVTNYHFNTTKYIFTDEGVIYRYHPDIKIELLKIVQYNNDDSNNFTILYEKI